MVDELLRDALTQIQQKGYAELKAKNPKRLHRSLYKAAKRRGFEWKFAKTHKSVIVKR